VSVIGAVEGMGEALVCMRWCLLCGLTLEFSGRQKAQLFDGPLE